MNRQKLATPGRAALRTIIEGADMLRELVALALFVACVLAWAAILGG